MTTGLRTPMIDGIRAGMDVGEYSVEIGKSTYQKLTRALRRLGGTQINDNTLAAQVAGLKKNSTVARLLLKQGRKYFFFNVQSNPISFISGQNVVGTPDMRKLLVRFYTDLEKAIGKQAKDESFEFGKEMWDVIFEGRLNIHSVTVAAYSERVTKPEKMAKLLKVLAHIYNGILRVEKGDNEERDWSAVSPADEAGYTCTLEGSEEHDGMPSLMLKEWDTSVRPRRVRSTLVLYSKVHEREAMGQALGEMECSVLEGRLRFDLRLSNWELQRARLSELRAWEKKAEKAGSYEELCKELITGFLERSGLIYAASFPNPWTLTFDDSVDRLTLNKWEKGEKLSERDTLMFHYKHNVDLRRSVNFHLSAAANRVNLSVDSDDVKAALKGDHTRYVSRMRKGLLNFNDNALAVSAAKVAKRLVPVNLRVEASSSEKTE